MLYLELFPSPQLVSISYPLLSKDFKIFSKFYWIPKFNTYKSLSQNFPSPPPKMYIEFPKIQLVWNCRFGVTPSILIGIHSNEIADKKEK